MCWRLFSILIVSAFIFTLTGTQDGQCEDLAFPPVSVVVKANESVVVDGVLDDEVWDRAPALPFYGLTDGSTTPWNCYGKIVWDDDYLYYGISIEDPDVWARLEPGKPDPDRYDGHADEFNMYSNPFAKIFFDPDGDGSEYIEVHINAMNQVDDARVIDSWFVVEDFMEPENWVCGWECEGLKTAVHIDGTLNEPRDLDKGWSVEAAFPWSSIKPIAKGNCPPLPGDTWRAHCGWVTLNAWHGKHIYYTWPVMGVQDCHILPRWGYITFAETFPDIPWTWYPGMPRK